MNETKKSKAAVCQFNIKLGAVEENIDAGVSAIGRACGKGAALVLLPELWSCGFDVDAMADHAQKTPRILERIGELASAHGAVIAGSLPERSGNAVYNTLFVVDSSGGVIGAYRKIHLFSLMDEDKSFAPGNKPVLCRTAGGALGLMICYDLRFPELCRSLAVNGADLVLVSAQWPASRIDHWDALLRARAIENQVFVMAANRAGRDEALDLDFNGHSTIISPTGEVIAECGDAPGEAIADIDLTEIARFRERFSTIAERVPDAYEF